MTAGSLLLALILFSPATSDRCLACHNGIVTATGHDISIGADWQTSMMANAARDPYWQAAVRREILDHPESAAAIEAECSKCHMPLARGAVFANLSNANARDGVSCSVCHRIEPDHLGEPKSFTGGFVLATESSIYGPFDIDVGRQSVMRSASAFTPEKRAHLRSSEMCATCHTLYTHALGHGGAVSGELPEQVPYLEWRASAFRGVKSCDACHMPLADGEAPITSVLGQPRKDVNRHVFRGGNFVIPRILNAFRKELGVVAPAADLELGIERTIEHLQTETARLEISDFRTERGLALAEIDVFNLAGHKLPTAYPSRRVWLHVVIRDENGRVIFESGRLLGNGSIEGNDNDQRADAYEPHWSRIERADQVQIWESVLADQDGNVTTGLLEGTHYIKDNRILPEGFHKVDAPGDIAVRGSAFADADFEAGRDRIGVAVPAPPAGRLTIEAELLYQPIGFRWAENLRAYRSVETQRFVRYYDALAYASAVVLARAEASSIR